MKTLITIAISLASLSTLGLVNWKMALSPVKTAQIPAHAQPQESRATDASDKGVELPAISLLHAGQRPLFAPDRRAWTPPLEPSDATVEQMPPEAPVVVPLAPPPPVTLLGIQKSPNGSTVLLAAEAGSAPIWLKEGESYQSWQVRNINAASVDLAYGHSRLTLELYPVLQTGPLLP